MEAPSKSVESEYNASSNAGNNGRKGKNIVICCDGTGNVIGEQQTNVVKLVRSIQRDRKEQCVYYDPGVGTMSAPEAMTKVAKGFSKVLGLALGKGIRRNIEEAYLFLMEHYQPNDKVFLFGFSRGAYTVCSLAAMLNKCGLLERGNENLISLGLQIYQNSQKKPADAQLFKATFSRECKPYFLGVWDTVASVGLLMNGDPFPSAAMNPDVQHVRHAVSIDEKRAKFGVEKWQKPAEAEQQTVKEVWFAGVHSDVGGGYPEGESGLSKIALEWMLKEAHDKGLIIQGENCRKTLGIARAEDYYHKTALSLPDNYHKRTPKPDHNGKLHNSLTLAWKVLDLLLTISPKYRIGRRREVPQNALIHESVLKRWWSLKDKSDGSKYTPRNLRHKIEALPENWGEAVNDSEAELPAWVIRREKIPYEYDSVA